ncbi:OB-fold domain-containing protein [Pseudomonas gingeri]|uniref:hydroxymethylglutaryl-CoA synthase family protein n=1 Tax=Pseudomonas gingeri TaxID=117681 RepID=UPI0015A14EC2|nr:3-oxoacyl-[acyl-carrier-protein] synthase III C-terminal domain-containing protein [Pseudomonas gingeri]NWD66917.1 OB-fold domain-containing protein [Pseudomonas gingeri]
MIGIVAYGGYIPRLRLLRQCVVQANAWFAPQLAGKARGARSMANWDEDSITMSVAAARDCLGVAEDRSHIRSLWLASNTLPFAERLNAGIVAEALTLDESIDAQDVTGSQRAGLSAVIDAMARAQVYGGNALVLAADRRTTRPASAPELDFGDGAAALLIGSEGVLAEYLGAGTVSVDFVDHFRAAGEEIDYQWEERWIRDEGVGKLVPRAINEALENSGVQSAQIDHFIFPSTFQKIDAQIAKMCGIRADAVVDNLSTLIGDTGTAHGLLLLAKVLETAKPGDNILVCQFGSGAQALVFRVTEAIEVFKPRVGVTEWLARGVEETNYTKFLSFNNSLRLERGMRGEQDKKTALTTLYRHRKVVLGLVAGRCSETGKVHFPPSRISYDSGNPLQDTQRPYKLAERLGTVLSWSAEYLSYHPSPPNYYGQVDFDGGGRILLEFTDIAKGEVDSGTRMDMVFRLKDIDELRGFNRYFWKATPVRASTLSTDQSKSE